MRLWFSSSSEVPIYKQLVTQIVLAILCGDLKAGDRLPSTRELARRFALHPNTISAGYRQLDREGWTEKRQGSGVYVRNNTDPPSTPEQILDFHIAGFFRAVRELNLDPELVRNRVAQWLAAPPPNHLLLIDPDPELRRILLTEIQQATQYPARAISLDDCADRDNIARGIPLCRPSKTKAVRAALPYGVELITMQIRSANGWLTPWLPVPEGHLIGVVSLAGVPHYRAHGADCRWPVDGYADLSRRAAASLEPRTGAGHGHSVRRLYRDHACFSDKAAHNRISNACRRHTGRSCPVRGYGASSVTPLFVTVAKLY